MSSTIVSRVSFFRRPKRRLKISSLPAQSRYAVSRILESDTLYYFLFRIGYKYPTYNSNGSFSDDL
ncbi:hypothetical protein NEISICOT_02313 [Neisseria sicca ATCC 29256]|uniref:Uncharacterized protein n=1 Tax=Neisseria sicca ATCC 29256 TaxID=547045 RepID=C6M709_NEISI|nr:hypothetical protein NEISICOT_02313 [Neisseria sicca ATCC 29256]